MPALSVIIPLYGSPPGRSHLREVTAAWLAQDVPCEVVLAVAGDLPVRLAADLDGRRTVRIVSAPASTTAPGLLRNLAVEHARADLLYLTDADVAPLGRDFVSRGLSLAQGGPLAQPWMHRLFDPDGQFDGRPVVDCRPVGRDPFCYVAAGPGRSLLADGEEGFAFSRPGGPNALRTPKVMPPVDARDHTQVPRRQWRAPYHWGGMLITHQLFESVGRYCPHYFGWGNEDDDLLVKVEARTGVVRGWQADPSWRCLHFEHPTAHQLTPQRAANAKRFAERLALGPDAMIAQDLAVHAAAKGGASAH